MDPTSAVDDNSTKAVEVALTAFGRGQFVILSDGKDVDSQCNLVLAAEHATPQLLAFMIRHSVGTIHACMDKDRLEAFGLHPASSSAGPGADVYVSTNFLPEVTNGVSAKDRAATLRALCDTSNPATSFSKPGHIVPRCAMAGGVLDCPRHSEACFDLCRCSSVQLVGAMAELMNEDGTMLSPEDVHRFSKMHSIPVVSVDQLRAYRRSLRKDSFSESTVKLESQSLIHIDDIEAECTLRVYRCSDPKIEIVTIAKGMLKDAEAVPARVHSECFTGDILGSKRCDCGQQLHKFLKIIDQESTGVLMYIRGHEGRGIGLANKIKAYKLQDEGFDTVDANLQLGLPVDSRTYEDALAVFKDLGLKTVKLYTNNPEKIQALSSITHTCAALASIPCPHSIRYLTTKMEKCNHRTVLETFVPPETKVDPSKVKIGVVYTTWNQFYVDELLQEALKKLDLAGARHVQVAVPGATDLISGARTMIRKHAPDAVIVLGVLIRGSSDVYDVTCSSVMTGLTELNAHQDIPITIGLLMCRDEDQAHERSHGAANPAKAWAETAMTMAAITMDTGMATPNRALSRQTTPFA